MQSERSRAVWRLGGLYWRLGLYYSGSMDNALASLDGPPNSLTRAITATSYEDALTEDEIDLLIGKYKLFAGKHSSQSDCSVSTANTLQIAKTS